MRLRTLIVEDDGTARRQLQGLLAAEPEVEVVADCTRGEEALAALDRHRPDLVLLEARTPGLDGFGVIERFGSDRMPATILLSADDRHAVRAFEVQAVDFLLRPLRPERFRSALSRARAMVEWRRWPAPPNPQRATAPRLVVRSSGRLCLLRPEEIDWVEAAGNYVRLHARGNAHLLRETMTGIGEKLPADRFVRIHRSAIVNLDRVRELAQTPHGDYEVYLDSGARLAMSRAYRERMEEALASPL